VHSTCAALGVIQATPLLPTLMYAGRVSVRLPFPPGVEYDYMQDPPAGSLPPRWTSGFVPGNEVLKSARTILSDVVVGVETVAVAPDGRLGLVDKFGQVRDRAPLPVCGQQGLSNAIKIQLIRYKFKDSQGLF
jgi:hypothetical protein